MWADNEVTVDLRNVSHLTTAVLSLVTNDAISPATIGVYGDWGSGKSTVLRLVQERLASQAMKDDGVVCVWFNSWQFESYDDAKAALMTAILEELRNQRGTLEKATAGIAAFARRIDWMRGAGLIGKLALRAKLAIATGGISEVTKGAIENLTGDDSGVVADLKGVLKEADPENTGTRSVREFRDEFAKLLEAADVKRLVVIIDDLDRCMPDRVVDTLEAIKLFLLVPHTSFVLGADEGLVRRSVQVRFAAVVEAKEQLGRDYLEKLIQIPVNVPTMSPEETEGYMNLLFAQKRLGVEAFALLCDKRASSDASAIDAVSFTFEDAKRILGEVPGALQEDFALVRKIAPLLAAHASGNPRQTKRFLNALMLRLEMANARKVTVRLEVMAKLMLLEYVRREAFVDLGVWQRAQGGRPSEIAKHEENAGGGPQGGAPATDGEWRSGDEWLRAWLRSEPKLAGQDLAPYYYFAPTRKAPGPLAYRLSPAAESVYFRLQSEAEPERLAGMSAAKSLPEADKGAVFGALKEKFEQSSGTDTSTPNSALLAMFELATQSPALVGELLSFLGRHPASELPAITVTRLHRLTEGTPSASTAQQLLETWQAHGSSKIGKAAATMLARAIRTSAATSAPRRRA
jgi:hypothetical protein